MNYAAIEFILHNIHNIESVFEYGSGESSLFWLDHGKRVVSIEHDPFFYRQLRARLAHRVNIDYRLIEPEIDKSDNPSDPTLPDYYQSSDFEGYSFKNYVESISSFPDESFDVVVVDGRARPACIAQAVGKVKCGGMLILDNSNREYYLRNTKKFVDGWERQDFVGTVRGLLHLEHTSVFVRK